MTLHVGNVRIGRSAVDLMPCEVDQLIAATVVYHGSLSELHGRWIFAGHCEDGEDHWVDGRWQEQTPDGDCFDQAGPRYRLRNAEGLVLKHVRPESFTFTEASSAP